MATDSFDFVIIGAGAAGSLLANRLSRRKDVTVCVLEGGPPDSSPFIHIPAGYIKTLQNPRYTALPKTEPSPSSGNRTIDVFQGRTLGGTSSINGMVYNRGQPGDYDAWAAKGNIGWSYADVLPYFKRTEFFIGDGDDSYRGRQGDLPITRTDYFHPITDAFIEGAVSIGIPRNDDYNGATQAGAGYLQRAIYRGRRMSGAQAFLRPARRRENLDIRTKAVVTRIVFDGRRATSVEYAPAGRRDRKIVVNARKEIVLCAGAVNSAKLLQVSGIGPLPLLNELGIPVVHELLGVGENLQDHYSLRLVAAAKNALTLNELSRGWRLAIQIGRWSLGLPSILAIVPTVAHVFWKTDLSLAEPDIQCFLTPGSFKRDIAGLLDDFPGMTCGFYQLRPESYGYVRARSSDALDEAIIQPNYLTSEVDQQVVLRGMRLVRRLFATPALARYFAGETTPGREIKSDDELLSFARNRGALAGHLMGTARMGPASDQRAVVDQRLRVHGIDSLRIADTSVMPTMPSGNTMAPTYMIAEKAAEMILQDKA